MPRILITSLGLAASLMPMVLYVAIGQASQPLASDFQVDIAPILKAHCSPCHFGSQNAGGLSLATFETLTRSSVVKRGILMDRILGKGGLPRMPLGFKPLSDSDTALIRQWIAQGAKPPAKGSEKQHWAFVAPKRPRMPQGGATNPIDSFVLARLKKEGLKPSPVADKTTLLRRLSFDLIGLPPTPAEVDAFLADKSPNAYEKVVDRLLASPHYGERMALPWLDAARYADSNGFQQDGDTFQYVWRDWVIKALNSNMPFDQFTIEQLAGDLLPKPSLDQLVATAFNRNHMLNGEGGAIPEEQRYVNLFDRVDTTSSTWLGLTLACARCHDHKYDPLTQKDYYAMMAYFNKVPETGVPAGSGQYRVADPWVYSGTTKQMAELAQAEQELATAKSAEQSLMSSPVFDLAFDKWMSAVREAIDQAAYGTDPWFQVGMFVGISFDDAFEREFGPERGLVSAPVELKDFVEGKPYPLTGDNTAFYFRSTIRVDRPVAYLLSLGSDDAIKVFLNGKEVVSRKVTRGVVPDSDRVIVQLQKGSNEILLKIVNGGGVGGFSYRGFPGGVDDAAAKLIRNEKPNLDDLKSIYARSFPSAELTKVRSITTAAQARLVKVQERLPRVMVMSDKMPRKTHVLNRGNYEELLEEVQPAPPKLRTGGRSFSEPGPGNRLGLSKWIVSPQNPLTARVQVNRAWTLFFGRGLVRTEENFGVKGEPPTHPELLDWLAVDLRENGWNMKRLHKQIVMSSTYRQSSRVDKHALKRDPANLYFARAPRFRLPSMILRDAALAASGLLDRKIGGKPVYPYQPKGIWDGLAITLERDFTYPQSKGADNHRRSLYTFWRRTAAPGNMFDSSSRQVCTVKPSLTSTPLHALTMLNDVTWVEAGRALALLAVGATDEARLANAFRRVCARRPKAEEMAVLKRALERSRRAYRADPVAALNYVSQGDSKFPTKQNVTELAALTAVCVAIFNLDEAMTRE